MSEWRIVETAPRDGQNILLWLHPEAAEAKGCPVAIMHYEERPLFGKTWTAPDGDWSCGVDCATHWIPLPEPPKC